MSSIKYIKLKGTSTILPLVITDENVEITDAATQDENGNSITPINTLAKAVNEVSATEIDKLFENSGQS